MPLKIRSKVDGFRRCSRAWPKDWVTVPDGTFTPEEVESLRNEPMLQVSYVAEDLAAPAELESESKPRKK